jgi:hypothetical protein
MEGEGADTLLQFRNGGRGAERLAAAVAPRRPDAAAG